MRRRREFIVLFVGAAAWPLVSHVQALPARPLVGFLAGASSASVLARTGPAFLAGLHEQGLVEDLISKLRTVLPKAILIA
jgi:hypothetical protein